MSRLIKSEWYKVISLPLFWIGVLVVFGISIFFCIQNIQVINATISGDLAAVNLELNSVSETPDRLVRDAILSSPYQASVLFLPLLIALVYATEYQFGQNWQSQLLIPSWKKRTTARIISLLVVVSSLTVVFSIVNSSLLLLLLEPSLKNLVTLILVGEVTLRVLLFSALLGFLALMCVTFTNKSIPALVLIISLLILSLSGFLSLISPHLNNLLPLLGAKSFAFGRVEGNQTSQLYGFVLLLIEITIACFLIYWIEWKRKLRC